jgi:hypothetical protein
MNHVITITSYLIVATGTLLVAAALLALACLATWYAGSLLWRRMRRIYRLATIWHYLEQLEKTGRYHFPPPDEDNP